MAATWSALNEISVTSTQSGTEGAPTDSADGIRLDGVMAITVWLDAGSGETITSEAGQADLYVYDNGAWGLAGTAPLLVPPHSAGVQRVSLGTIVIENQRGRLAAILNGVTVSGSTAQVDIMATVDRLGRARAA